MEHTEFTLQVDKHKAMLRKNHIVFGILGYLKLMLSLLIGATLSFIFFMGFHIGVVAAVLAEASAFAALWIYQDKLRGKINHSNELIIIYKGHIYRLSSIWEAFPCIDNGSLNYGCPDFTETEIGGETSFIQFLETVQKGQVLTDGLQDPPMYSRNNAIKFLLM